MTKLRDIYIYLMKDVFSKSMMISRCFNSSSLYNHAFSMTSKSDNR